MILRDRLVGQRRQQKTFHAVFQLVRKQLKNYCQHFHSIMDVQTSNSFTCLKRHKLITDLSERASQERKDFAENEVRC